MNKRNLLNAEQGKPSPPYSRKRQKTSGDVCPPTLRHDDYTIAWICALYIEMAAALTMLDETHASLPTSSGDTNTYTLGQIAQHKVVIVCLPAMQYGTINAANVVTNLRRTFPSIRAGLMVGIGGGVPGKDDIRLGDIVVGTRVMQSDLGKVVENGELRRTAIARLPDQLLCTAVSSLRAKHELQPSRVSSILRQKLEGYPEYKQPQLPDRLFQATYNHVNPDGSCNDCDDTKLLPRSTRASNSTKTHYDGIASGNQAIKCGQSRDHIARELDSICFEMEAAGLMDVLPCLPIRGICDYSDSHKNKEWQRVSLNAQKIAHVHDPVQVEVLDRRQLLLDSLDFDKIDFRRSTIKPAHAKTCEWFLNHLDYLLWLGSKGLRDHHGFLWISGKPGAGKSTIMKFAYLNSKKKARSGKNKTASRQGTIQDQRL
ncbi:nucleoside phosphorylase domain-containing protein [Aspergillus multicolor]|uniref:nucleoside phosphorylase domain-containing protein n=1 Tax=Aspergillus multicolor TaxID=41759 RepID=UPI003CCDE21B